MQYCKIKHSLRLAIKSVKQSFTPTSDIFELMKTFRQIVNDCIRIGLQHDVSSMKQLCGLAYKQLSKYEIISYYKLCAIYHAAGMLANRKKSLKRGFRPRNPYARRQLLASCYGFKIRDVFLKIPLGNGQYFDIKLNSYVSRVLADPNIQVRAFILTADSVKAYVIQKK